MVSLFLSFSVCVWTFFVDTAEKGNLHGSRRSGEQKKTWDDVVNDAKNAWLGSGPPGPRSAIGASASEAIEKFEKRSETKICSYFLPVHGIDFDLLSPCF